MKYTLLADGTSDKALIPILNWCHHQHSVRPAEIQWVDSSRIPRGTDDPTRRVLTVLDLYPCDVLLVHRDAEAQPVELRRTQIAEILESINIPHIPVVPIRMTEAWLLFDERAIRSAAGNPSGTVDLRLPRLRALERVVDPKEVLYEALRVASDLNRRRRSALRLYERVHRIPNYIGDFSPLRELSAFRGLEHDLRICIDGLR